jgi:formylglycine-generating enzyme required for sulfatase activity
MMGSTEAEIAKISTEVNSDLYKNEAPQHKATIKQGFYLSETEVTQAQWQAIMIGNPSYFKNKENNAPKDTDSYPVEGISWIDVQEFFQKLNVKSKVSLRLPTEAEWEYACRARTTSRFGFGDGYADLGDYAWYGQNFGRITHGVSGNKANNFGLYDMHGNVWEWCEDDWHENYQGAPNEGNAWTDAPRGVTRVLRGGSWYSNPRNCCSTNRDMNTPDYTMNDIGFRCARDIQK